MTTKGILYIITLPIVIWALDSINLNGIIKKNRYYQVRMLYFVCSMALSYLVVNFLYDFVLSSKIV